MRSRALGLAALAFLVGLCASLADGARPAFAQQLDAGKPPSQIFSGTCSLCHRSPRGLLRTVSPRSLPGFMRQHYTTGSDMAGAMAAYVLANGGTERVAEPPPRREPKQKAKSDSQDVAARPSDAKEQQKARRQKDAKKGKAETSKDVEKQESEKQDEVKQQAARPPGGEAETSAEEKSATPPAEPPKVVECRIIAPAPPPREPASLITLPGFPPPVVEPPPVPVTDPPGCDPAAAPAEHSEAEQGTDDKAATPDSAAETPKLDIMREEAHSDRQKKRAE